MKSKEKILQSNLFRKIIYGLIICLLISGCSGCKKLKNEKITVTIISEKAIESQKEEIVTNVIKSISNYYVSPNHNDTVLFPTVAIYRMDLNQTKNIDISVSGANKIRKSVGLLSTKQLMETYDTEIPKLTFPEILRIKETKNITQQAILDKYPKFIAVDLSLSIKEIDSLKSSVYDSLFALKSNTTVVFLLIDGKIGKYFPSNIYLRDTCDYTNHISYKLVTDGKGGFKFGDKIKDSSVECGYAKSKVSRPIVKPTPQEERRFKKKKKRNFENSDEIDLSKSKSDVIKVKKKDIKN